MRILTARTKGICPACKQPFARGDEVALNSDLRRYHPECREKVVRAG